MKDFFFLTIGFEQPTEEMMGEWGKWFESLGDKLVFQGGLMSGREFTSAGTAELPFDLSALTGYCVIRAADMDEASKLAETCPIITSNQLYEIRTAADHAKSHS